MKIIISFLIIGFVFSTCSDKPAGLIEAEKMQRILWDVMKADALARNFSYRDSSKNDTLENAARQRIIFEHYKVSKKEYYKSFAYYNSKPDLFQVLLDSALVKGKRRDSVTYALPTAIP